MTPELGEAAHIMLHNCASETWMAVIVTKSIFDTVYDYKYTVFKPKLK